MNGRTAAKRLDLIAWLRGQKPDPKVAAPAPADPAVGSVTSSLRTGTIFLAPKEPGSAPGRFRLVWEEGDPERTRPVPPGTYQVLHFGIERRWKGGTWMTSVSGQGPTVEVAAGRTTHVELDERIQVRPSAKKGACGFVVGLAISGPPKMGLSLLAPDLVEGVDCRVPVTVAGFDAEGREIERVRLRYG